MSGMGTCPFQKAQAGNDALIEASVWETDPDVDESPEERENIGDMHVKKAEYSKAVDAYDRAITMDPRSERAHVGKVVALRHMKQFLRSFAACRQGLEHVPGSVQLQRLKDEVHWEYKSHKEVQKRNHEHKLQETRKLLDQTFMQKAVSMEGPEVPPNPSAPIVEGAQWWGKNPSEEERRQFKAALLGSFRELYGSLGKSSVGATTGSYTDAEKAGLVIKAGHRPMPRPQGVQLPENFKASVGVMSPQQLAEFSSRSCNGRLLISVYGDIFDVSDRPDKYGGDGPYYYFSGKDITWGLVSGNDTEQNCNHFYDLWKIEPENARVQKLQCACGWLAFYEKEYGNPVGRLDVWSSERYLPPPPKEHMQQCALM